MDLTSLEQSVLQFVSQPGYRAMKPRIIARNLGLAEEQAGDVKKAVKRLVRLGQLQYGANHLVRPVFVADAAATPTAADDAALDKRILEKLAPRLAGPKKSVTGKSVTGKSAAGKSVAKIAPGRVGGAVQPHGKRFRVCTAARCKNRREGNRRHLHPRQIRRRRLDRRTVLVQISKRRPGEPGLRGEIVEILERQTHQFVGTYFESRGSGYVQVDGTLFAQPIYVGDPAPRTRGPTTRWCSRWSASLRRSTTAKA